MSALAFVICFVLFLAVFAVVLWRLLLTRKENLRGEVRAKKFMTGNEVEFYSRLSKALPEFLVFPQVAMGALLEPDVPSSHRNYWQIRDTFAQKVCDFVVCDKRTLAPLFVIELDDRTHDFEKDAIRDDIVVLGALRTLRFWSRKKPSSLEIRERVARAVGPAVGFTV